MILRRGTLKLLFLVFILLFSQARAANIGAPACAEIKSLEVRYKDFRPTQVEILLPCSEKARLPYVILTSYFALVDKDYFSGANPEDAAQTDRRSELFMFGTLARELASKGFAVVKYDPIAIHPPAGSSNAHAESVIDQDELLRVTREDFSGLLDAVVRGADQAVGSDRRRPIIFVAHSGGAFTVGDYLERLASDKASASGRKIGFVGISPSVSSDTGAARSYRDYWLRTLKSCLEFRQRSACLEEFKADALFTQLFNELRRKKIVDIFGATGSGDDLLDELRKYLDTVVVEVDSSNRASSQGYAYLNGKYKVRADVVNSLIFRRPSAVPISCTATSARLVFGSNDLIISSEVEKEAWVSACGKPPQVLLVSGVGHSLGEDRYVGPIRADAKALVLTSVLRVADELQ